MSTYLSNFTLLFYQILEKLPDGANRGSFVQNLLDFLPTAIVAVVFTLLFIILRLILKRQGRGRNDWGIIQQIILFLVANIGIIVFILTLPMNETIKGQITQLLGIVISAVIALSSATLIGNMLAGILLRIISSFKPGDFIEVNDIFGRISERGLFHTELQTVESDLMTLPNLMLVTNAVKVKRSSGTFISCSISLGYDISRIEIERCLIAAAEKAGLEDNYVNIVSLGDFAVVYEVHGKLNDVKKIITKRSLLRAMVLDVLHEAKIEIVSPTFMNQRQIGDRTFVPRKKASTSTKSKVSKNPEVLIFDKAEKAESIENRKEREAELEERIKELQAQQKEAADENAKAEIQEEIDKLKTFKEKIQSSIEKSIEKLDEDS